MNKTLIALVGAFALSLSVVGPAAAACDLNKEAAEVSQLVTEKSMTMSPEKATEAMNALAEAAMLAMTPKDADKACAAYQKVRAMVK